MIKTDLVWYRTCDEFPDENRAILFIVSGDFVVQGYLEVYRWHHKAGSGCDFHYVTDMCNMCESRDIFEPHEVSGWCYSPFREYVNTPYNYYDREKEYYNNNVIDFGRYVSTENKKKF